MPARIVFLLLVLLSGGSMALVAADSGAIRTNATNVTSTPVPVQSNQIWSALVLATNVANPKPAPEELQEFVPRMKRVFGYNQFELAGSASQEIGDQNESWLVPSKSFSMALRGRRALSKEAQGGFLLNLQLYQDKRPLVDTELKLAPGSPLFIRGPQYGKGQLIIVLQVQR